MIKNAYMATSWDEYTAQGPAYKAIEDWWKTNWQQVSNTSGPTYNSWTSWYMQHFYNDWGRAHKGPEETLSILKREATAPSSSSHQQTVKERMSKMKNFFSGRLPRIRNRVRKGSGVNIDNVTPQVKDFLDTIAGVAEKLNVQTPFVTSGYRSTMSQARVMGRNWERHGGSTLLSENQLSQLGSLGVEIVTRKKTKEVTLGLVYLYKLYKNKNLAIFVDEVYSNYGVNRNSKRIVSEYIESNPGISSHIKNPAEAVDLRLTNGIKQVLDTVDSSGEFALFVLYEGDHYHVRVQ